MQVPPTAGPVGRRGRLYAGFRSPPEEFNPPGPLWTTLTYAESVRPQFVSHRHKSPRE
jgi:hypothetical protein